MEVAMDDDIEREMKTPACCSEHELQDIRQEESRYEIDEDTPPSPPSVDVEQIDTSRMTTRDAQDMMLALLELLIVRQETVDKECEVISSASTQRLFNLFMVRNALKKL
jgi:hypothetical protein